MKQHRHPSVISAQYLREICMPLQKLGITYFAHANVDNNGHFSAINNNPAFMEHYLNNNYYNVDIHMGPSVEFGKYVIWDHHTRIGKTHKMHQEASEFGAKHTFTIMEQDSKSRDLFHFATDKSDASINQVYLNNLDALKLFVLFYREHLQNADELSAAHKAKLIPDSNAAGYTFLNANFQCGSKREFQDALIKATKNSRKAKKIISSRELEILTWLHLGKTTSQIAQILNLAEITVNKNIANIKSKTNCFTMFQLGQFFSTYLQRV